MTQEKNLKKNSLRKFLYEGKAKIIYQSEKEDEVEIHFKNTATAFNGQKKEEIPKKGKINQAISVYVFKELERYGISSHFVRALDERTILARKLEIIPLEVVVRNRVAGSLAKRTGCSQGTEIEPAIVEFYYKDDSLGDPLLNEDHIRFLGLAEMKELKEIRDKALRINSALKEIFSNIDLILVDFKLEFGRSKGEIVLGDEITPDTCRLWDRESHKILDKDRFRKGMDQFMESYEEILRRLSSLKNP